MATVIVLNGTSSSGKTTIARAFQEVAPSVFLNFSSDAILDALPPSTLERLKRGAETADPKLLRAFYACVRELAGLGNDVIVDHAVTSRAEAELLVASVESHRTLIVGLECSADVLAQRERARGDRRAGLAAAQLERIHRWLAYDLIIDTAQRSPDEVARAIVAMLSTPGDDALERTRARLAAS